MLSANCRQELKGATRRKKRNDWTTVLLMIFPLFVLQKEHMYAEANCNLLKMRKLNDRPHQWLHGQVNEFCEQ